MRNLRSFFLVILVVFAGATIARTQDNTVLIGKVRGEDHKQAPPADWKVDVSAVVAGARGDPISDVSNGDPYGLEVPTNATVRLLFHSPGYVTEELNPINTRNTRTLRVQPNLVVLTKFLGNSLLKTKSGRQGVISKIVEFAKATGAIDSAMYDLALLRAEMTNNIEALADIELTKSEIKSSMQFIFKITPERQQIWVLFDKIIERNRGNNVAIDPESLLKLIENDGLTYGVRYDAIRALGTSDLNEGVKQKALSYFRDQSKDTSAALFMPARYALAKIGTGTDKQSIIADVNSSDYERSIASITAIGNANLLSGNSAIAKLAESQEASPAVRLAAIQSLETLATKRERNQIAIEALTNIYEDMAKPEQFRIQAVETLRAVDLSTDQRIRIKNVASKDPSQSVRTAATGLGRP